AHRASCHLTLGEAQMSAGRLDEARTLAEAALALSCEHQEHGQEAYSLRLLGEVAARGEPLEGALAEDNYRRALTLAEALGMRPLVAHCHLGLGKMHHRTGDRGQAQEHLIIATAMYREMAMTYWLEQAEAELHPLG